nr:cobalt transporter CbiM [Thioflavicoccus mobilis]
MAHIPDGVLAAPVLITGAVVTAGAVLVGLRRLDYERIPQAAVLAAAFFVASLIAVPVGPSSVHLLLNGLMGLVLGWAAVPAILVALVLQAVFFGFGGLLVLGVNTMNMALPALICAALFRAPLCRQPGRWGFLIGAGAGALGVLLTGVLIAMALAASGSALVPAAKIILLTYLPLAFVEALVTGAAVTFLGRVAPEILCPMEATGHDR